MARVRDDMGDTRWGRLQRWLREGDDSLDRAMIAVWDESAEPEPEPVFTVPPARPEQKKKNQKHTAKLEKLLRVFSVIAAVLLCVGIIGILLHTTALLPSFGREDNPVHNEVPRRYIEKGMNEDTGAVNIVAGMILDYRAFDTLGESNVLFVAVCTVMILLRLQAGDPDERLGSDTRDRLIEPHSDPILQVIARVLIPLILIFGAYVILNGHISPGGGFSGGAIMGAALILHMLAFGEKQTARFFSYRTYRAVSVCALGFYALAKAYSFFTGANHLPSIITIGTPGRIFSAGLIPYLNIAVGLVVCCTMYALFSLFRKGEL
ncbi:MAG: hypothetical protein IJK28_11900 [Clostridia bacterium]|nr:hypothetical protein [Clostridia bacterium]